MLRITTTLFCAALSLIATDGGAPWASNHRPSDVAKQHVQEIADSRPVGLGDTLPEMALFVEPNEAIPVPLEATCQASYVVLPRRWRDVLDTAADG